MADGNAAADGHSVLVEGRSERLVTRRGVSRPWVITLVQRYLAEGQAGLEPRS